MIAGAAFIGFAFWTLKPEKEGEENELRMQFGAVATVSSLSF